MPDRAGHIKRCGCRVPIVLQGFRTATHQAGHWKLSLLQCLIPPGDSPHSNPHMEIILTMFHQHPPTRFARLCRKDSALCLAILSSNGAAGQPWERAGQAAVWMDLWEFFPKVKTTKRVVFYSGSVTIIWYLMHIPLVYYMIHTFAHEKQHTIAVNNSPFLLLNVDVNTLLSNLPLMATSNTTQIWDPTISMWCAMAAAGPFSCRNSTAEIYQECVARCCLARLCLISVDMV